MKTRASNNATLIEDIFSFGPRTRDNNDFTKVRRIFLQIYIQVCIVNLELFTYGSGMYIWVISFFFKYLDIILLVLNKLILGTTNFNNSSNA